MDPDSDTITNDSEVLFAPRMKPNIPKKINHMRTLLIGLAFLSAQASWAYYNMMMPIFLGRYFSDFSYAFISVDTLTGIIMVVDNLVAVLALPYFGVLSDHTKSKHGRRMPYILIGCTLGSLLFSAIPYMDIIYLLFAVIVFFNLSMAFYRTACISLMPDLTDPVVRSTGNSIIQIMGAIGYILGFLAPILMELIYAPLKKSATTDKELQIYDDLVTAGGFHFISAIMLISLIILYFTIRETPTGTKFLQISRNIIDIDPITLEYNGEIADKKVSQHKKKDYLIMIFRKENQKVAILLLAIFASMFGFSAIETFYSKFATIYLGWSISQAALILMMAPISLVIFAVPVGHFSDKIGRKRAFMIGLVGISICVEIMHYTKSYDESGFLVSIITIIFIGIFLAMISINAIVLVWQFAPEGNMGAYTGAYYLFAQTASILSPIVIGLQFDLYVKLFPENMELHGIDSGYQYRLLFVFVLIWQLIALFLLSKVKIDETTSLNNKEVSKIRNQMNNDQ